MILNNLKPFIYVSFHIFIDDQMFLELFSQFRTQSFDAINLFSNSVAYF
jgi:hypothetical protein